MTQILELRQKRAKAWDAAKAFLDSHRDSNGTVSVEDAATYDMPGGSVYPPEEDAVSGSFF